VRHNANKSTSDERVENNEKNEKVGCIGRDSEMEKTDDDGVKMADDGDLRTNDSDVERLLRMAGLLSDSPPNSPERSNTIIEDNSSLKGEADVVHTETKEMQEGQREEPEIECIGSHHRRSEREEEKLENDMDPSSVSDQKESLGIPKDSSVVVKTSENQAMDGKNAPEGETGDTAKCDEFNNVNKDSNDNNNKGEQGKEGCESEGESCAGSKSISHNREKLSCSPTHSMVCENAPKGEKRRGPVNQQSSDAVQSISEKVIV
jgi:hypothetical protein